MRITIWMSITLIYMCHHLNSYPQCVNNCQYINVRVSLWCLTHHWSSSRGLSSTDRIKKIKLHNILNLLHQPQFYWWDLWKNRNNRWTMRRRQNFRRRWSLLLLLLPLLSIAIFVVAMAFENKTKFAGFTNGYSGDRTLQCIFFLP